jgi:hypothetical protein
VAKMPTEMGGLFPDLKRLLAPGCGAATNHPVVLRGRLTATASCPTLRAANRPASYSRLGTDVAVPALAAVLAARILSPAGPRRSPSDRPPRSSGRKVAANLNDSLHVHDALLGLASGEHEVVG